MRKIYITIIILFVTCINIFPVYALNNDLSQYAEVDLLVEENKDNCPEAFLGDPGKEGSVAYYLQTVLDVIKYVGIVLCIVLTIYDFVMAITQDDKGDLKPLVKTAFTRFIYAAMLFFLPIIVNVLLSLIGVYGTCGIG